MGRRTTFLAYAFVCSFTTGVAVAQPANQTITLRVVEIVDNADGTTTITLASGLVFTVVPKDVVTRASRVADSSVATAVPSTSGLCAMQYAGPAENSKRILCEQTEKLCATQWPSDPTQRILCERRQQDAKGIVQFRDRAFAATAGWASIRDACQRAWPIDYERRNQCELEGLDR
jgi:hypothetical protein